MHVDLLPTSDKCYWQVRYRLQINMSYAISHWTPIALKYHLSALKSSKISLQSRKLSLIDNYPCLGNRSHRSNHVNFLTNFSVICFQIPKTDAFVPLKTEELHTRKWIAYTISDVGIDLRCIMFLKNIIFNCLDGNQRDYERRRERGWGRRRVGRRGVVHVWTRE